MADTPLTDRRTAFLLYGSQPREGCSYSTFLDVTRTHRAYDVLSSDTKRKQYDATGRAELTADEELLNGFAGGTPITQPVLPP